MLQNEGVWKLLERMEASIEMAERLRKMRKEKGEIKAFTDQELGTIYAYMCEFRETLRDSLDQILPTQFQSDIFRIMDRDYTDPDKVMWIFDLFPLEKIRERCVNTLCFHDGRDTSFQEVIEWTKRRVPVLLQSKIHFEKDLGRKLLERMIFETEKDCKADCLEFALQCHDSNWISEREVFKLLSNALQKNPSLYWLTPSVRIFINRMLEEVKPGNYWDFAWIETQRAIRHIVRQKDVTYLPRIEKILSWHTKGTIVYKDYNAEDVFLLPRNQTDLQTAVDALKNAREIQWPRCSELVVKLSKIADLRGGVDVDFSFMNDSGKCILHEKSVYELEIQVSFRLKAKGEMEKFKTFLQKSFIIWDGEGFEKAEPLVPSSRKKEQDFYYIHPVESSFTQSDFNPLIFFAGFKVTPTMGNNRFSLQFDLGGKKDKCEMEFMGYVIVGEEKPAKKD